MQRTECLAMILAGGKGSRLGVLTKIFNHYDALRKTHYNLSAYTAGETACPVRKGNGSCINHNVRIL